MMHEASQRMHTRLKLGILVQGLQPQHDRNLYEEVLGTSKACAMAARTSARGCTASRLPRGICSTTWQLPSGAATTWQAQAHCLIAVTNTTSRHV